jgi:hypothetical protein
VKLAGPCLFLALTGIFGCQSPVVAGVETGGEESTDFNQPVEPTLAAQQSAPASGTASQGVALLGARQDLSFRGPATTQCKCLAVATGLPGDAAFQWSGPKPEISPGSQLVVALSSAGIECPEAGANAAGASYWGYEVSGADVVVVVESGSPKHPLASGAVVPRPGSGGHLYVRPIDKALPYGKPTSGTGARCKVGAVANLDSPAPATSAAPASPVAPERPIPPPMPTTEPATGTGSAKGSVSKGIKVKAP